jgi:hypothetical protein
MEPLNRALVVPVSICPGISDLCQYANNKTQKLQYGNKQHSSHQFIVLYAHKQLLGLLLSFDPLILMLNQPFNTGADSVDLISQPC